MFQKIDGRVSQKTPRNNHVKNFEARTQKLSPEVTHILKIILDFDLTMSHWKNNSDINRRSTKQKINSGKRILYTTGVTMRKKQIATLTVFLWLLIILVSMFITQRFDFELFFILGFIAFLIIIELLEPNFVKPANTRYVNYIVISGILIFCVIIIQKIIEMIGI
jgi:hypothetical protein